MFNPKGEFIRKFGSEGNGEGQFQSPWGIAFLSNGHVVVSECEGNHRLQIFDAEGTFIKVLTRNREVGFLWGLFGYFLSGSKGMKYPFHLFVDSDDNILVADHQRNHIQVFNLEGVPFRTIGQGKLANPMGIWMDHLGRVIVTECGENRISIF